MCTWLVSTIYSLTPPLPELVPVRHGHPRPPEGPRPRRGAAASQIRRQSTGTRSGDLRSSEAYALPIQGYHMDLSTGACGGAGGPSAQPLFNSGSTPRICKLRTTITTHQSRHTINTKRPNKLPNDKKKHQMTQYHPERRPTVYRASQELKRGRALPERAAPRLRPSAKRVARCP